MPGTVPSTLDMFIHLTLTIILNIIITAIQIKKLWQRDVKLHVQGYIAIKRQSQGLNGDGEFQSLGS